MKITFAAVAFGILVNPDRSFSFVPPNAVGNVVGRNSRAPTSRTATACRYRANDEDNRGIKDEAKGSSQSDPAMGLGENWALTYVHSGSACLDLFFDSVPSISRDSLIERLDKAWREDPLMTLKIVFQLGDPREGKGDRNNYYVGLLWLYDNHYDTLMLNLNEVPRLACYKALLDLLLLSCHGPRALDDKRVWRNAQKRTERRRRTNRRHMTQFFQKLPSSLKEKWSIDNCKMTATIAHRGLDGKGPIESWANDELRDLFVQYVHSLDRNASEEACRVRKAKRDFLNHHADHKRKTDLKYSNLYNAVADIFARDLSKDQEKVHNGKPIGGLAAKWAPTVGQSHDRHTGIVDGIVERLYPQSTHRLTGGTYQEYLSFMRDRYRKEYLSPQRRAAEIPEHFIGGSEWSLVNYERMASRCRHVHGHIYEKHDGERYRRYVEDAKADVMDGGRQRKIAAGVLLPHEVTARATESDEKSTQADEANLQWLRIVQDTKESGCLPSAVAICDVSGSMYGEPMDVAVALSLLVSDVADAPEWKNKIITFSEKPQFVTVPEATTDNLANRVEQIKGMDWGYNTNFQAVFRLLLSAATFMNVRPEGMPKVLFCFSDMEFDRANEGGGLDWATDLEQIRRAYGASGYPVPQLVFWNLRPSISRPSSYSEPGVAMLSGFSAGMMKSFLEFQLSDMTPIAQLMRALLPYDGLKVAKSDQLPVKHGE